MRDVLVRLREGELTVDEALAELRQAELVALSGRARLDTGRPVRRGIPEVVLAAGKDPREAAALVAALAQRVGQGLISRLDAIARQTVEAAAAEGGLDLIWYGEGAAALRRPEFRPAAAGGRVALLTAGTSDRPVAEEARMVLEAAGMAVQQVFDVGVAGLHRLLAPLAELVAWEPDVYIVAAGMDGVLPGVVAGLVAAPVIGVPVATGYGRGGAGEAALDTMLQSCATGLLVVNIGNGVGAGAAASLIAAGAAAARRQQPGPARPRQAARSRPEKRARSTS